MDAAETDTVAVDVASTASKATPAMSTLAMSTAPMSTWSSSTAGADHISTLSPRAAGGIGVAGVCSDRIQSRSSTYCISSIAGHSGRVLSGSASETTGKGRQVEHENERVSEQERESDGTLNDEGGMEVPKLHGALASELTLFSVIGKGGFGTVYRGKFVSDLLRMLCRLPRKIDSC